MKKVTLKVTGGRGDKIAQGETYFEFSGEDF